MGDAMFGVLLSEFSGVVLSCFTLSRSTVLTDQPNWMAIR